MAFEVERLETAAGTDTGDDLEVVEFHFRVTVRPREPFSSQWPRSY